MATKLKNMKLTSVDLVRSGANQEADICLFKSADPPGATEMPTEAERGIFKRFINWLLEDPEIATYEPQNVAKDDPRPKEAETFDEVQDRKEPNDTLDDYLDALEYSYISIQIDDDLDESEKNKYMLESLQEFVDAMEELIPELATTMPRYDDAEKSADLEENEEIEKFNQNHGRDGKFTSAGGASGSAGVASSAKELNDLPKRPGVSKVSYEDIKAHEKVLDKMPVGTKIQHKTDAGDESFTKVSQSKIGSWWEHTRAPHGDTKSKSGFDVAQWMAGGANISRGPYEIVGKSADIEEIEEMTN